MTQNTKVTLSLRGVYILLSVVLATVLACAACSGIMLSMALRGAEEEAAAQLTRENDVVIADDYPILSTTHISDAYRSGDASRLSQQDAETLTLASALLNDIITDGMTDFEKEQAVFDWMSHNLSGDSGMLTLIPTTQKDAHTPYGALKYHNAVCVGYATTFRLLMHMLNIPCMVIHNTELYHSWNLVQLEGDWYHVDVYSAAANGSYASFNAPDAMISQEWDTGFFPAAAGLTYNPAWMAAETLDDIYQLPRWLRRGLEEGRDVISLRFGSDCDAAQRTLIEAMVTETQSILADTQEYQSLLTSFRWCPTEEGIMLVVYLLDDDDTTALSPDQQEQVTAAVEDAFSDLMFPDDPVFAQ